MAKKSFEKKAERIVELPSKVYEQLAEYWEKQADLYKLKFRISFVFVLLEALVI